MRTRFLIIVLFAFNCQTIFSQTETFDIAHYTPPKDWKRQEGNNVVTYLHTIDTSGAFCLIAIYKSTIGTGDAKKDFTQEWKDRIIPNYKVAANPSTEEQSTPDGWKALTAATKIKLDSADAMLIATVFSGFKKKMTITATLNDQSYLPMIDSFLENLQLDKAVVVAKETKTTGQKPSTPINNPTGEEKFGHIIFSPIEGWNVDRYANGIIMTPRDLSSDQYFQVRLMPSKSFSGSLTTALAESWQEMMTELQCQPAYIGKLYDITTNERKSFKGWNYTVARGTLRRNSEDPAKYDAYLFLVKINNRVERLLVVGLLNIQGGSYSPMANPVYASAIDEFFFNLKFDDWQEPVLQKPMIYREGITGMYQGLALKGGTYEGTYALFYSNGQVFYGSHFPSRGFYDLNTWIAAEKDTRSWGTYTYNNGKGVITMGYGKIPFRVDGEQIIMTTQNTEHKYERVLSVDAAQLDGTYRFPGDWGKKNPSIRFTADGKFTDYGALNVLNHQLGDPFDISTNPGSGSYLIKDYSITFNYSDGRTIRLLFLGENGFTWKNPRPPTLVISANHDILKRIE